MIELIVQWLIQQAESAPLLFVMAVIIYWLQAKLKQVETEKKDLAKDVNEIVALWERNGHKLNEDSREDADTKKEILTKLTEIKTLIKAFLVPNKE